MIVTCEKCETRYRLDDARVAAATVRVRCSRCKHAFTVDARGESGAAALHAIAEQAAADPEAPPGPPDVTQDLLGFTQSGLAGDEPGPSGEDATVAMRRRGEEAPPLRGQPSDEDDEESDWQFNEDPADLEPGASAAFSERAAGFEAPSAARSAVDDLLDGRPEAEGSSLDELGSPESWDFLRERAPAPDSAAQPAREEPAPPARSEPIDAATAARPADEPAPVAGPAPSPFAVLSPLAVRALSALAWLATAAGLAIVAWGALAPAREQPPATTAVAGLVTADVRGRFVENALGGDLFVVSGSLRNSERASRAPDAPVQVRLLAADGTPLDATAWVGPALSEVMLRETAPEVIAVELAGRAARLAQTPLAAGGRIDFHAVFADLPDDAARFRIEAVPVPGGRPAPPQGGAETAGPTAPTSPR